MGVRGAQQKEKKGDSIVATEKKAALSTFSHISKLRRTAERFKLWFQVQISFPFVFFLKMNVPYLRVYTVTEIHDVQPYCTLLETLILFRDIGDTHRRKSSVILKVLQWSHVAGTMGDFSAYQPCSQRLGESTRKGSASVEWNRRVQWKVKLRKWRPSVGEVGHMMASIKTTG